MIELINFIKMRWDESDSFPKTTIKFMLKTRQLNINRSIMGYRTLGSYSTKLIKMVLV